MALTTMELDYLVRLTLSLYNVTEGFQDELLRLKLRRIGVKILKDFVIFTNEASSSSDPLSGIVELEETLEWARREKTMGRKNFVFLKDEYGRVKEFIKREKSQNGAKAEEKKEKRSEVEQKSGVKKEVREKDEDDLKEREKKVLRILREMEKAQVNELKEYFPNISKRTLRRDIDSLLSRNLIVRRGKWNDVYYVLA